MSALQAHLILLAEPGVSESASYWPYVIGGGTLAILLGSLAALVAFGAGREHS
ncbi:MAG: hypothetical protein V9F00_18610 [Nocardioides sp.]|jgi:hypothetical protein